MLKAILYVGIGGGMGSILRYLTSVFIGKYGNTLFPYATFIINLIGCLLVGIFLGIIQRKMPINNDLIYLLTIGFCGGYTTFSTFANESYQLFINGQLLIALVYTSASVILGVVAVWLGLTLSEVICKT